MTADERAHELRVLTIVPRGWEQLDWIKALRAHARRDNTSEADAEVSDEAAYRLMRHPQAGRLG